VSDWFIYHGNDADARADAIERLPPPPRWRQFDGGPPTEFDRDDSGGQDERQLGLAAEYLADEPTLEMVNTALYLRRPLLVTGAPGTGKSSLAAAVAHELRLGRVLRWPISSRSVLKEGLYRYDAIGRIEDANIARDAADRGLARQVADQTTPDDRTAEGATIESQAGEIGRYIRLGPLGTALAPFELPRVLLIDEIDKSDIDLPNDLLDVFEEGEFEIPELSRLAGAASRVPVRPADGGAEITVVDGRVRCRAFPFVVLTSNGERDFPAAFLRRCVRLEIKKPDPRRLTAIVEAHLGAEAAQEGHALVQEFVSRRELGEMATDQLLNAIYLLRNAAGAEPLEIEKIAELALRQLNSGG
jgi:MoxR-like ATPase